MVNRICFSALAFLGIYIAAFQRILDDMAIDFSLTRVLMGFLISAHFFGLFVGPLIAGELSDKYGRKVIILGSFAAFLTGLMVIYISPNFYILILGAFLIGIGFGTVEVVITALLTDIAPEASNKTIATSQIFFGAGAALGPFIALGFLMLFFQWRLFYIASILIVSLFIFIFLKYPYPDYKPGEKVEGVISAKLIKNKVFVILLLSMIMYVCVEEGIGFWITSYVKEWTLSKYLPSIILSSFWASMILGRYVISRFSNKLNELIIIGACISAAFLSIILVSNIVWINIIAFFGLGLGLSGIWPMIMALTKIYFPKYSGTAFGIMMAGCAVGGAVMPLLMGFIGATASLKLALALCLVPIFTIAASHSAIRYIFKYI